MSIAKHIKNKYLKGFTLLEILLVVAAIAMLAGIIVFAINPNKQLGDTRNAQRRVDVNTILNATYQYLIDNSQTSPSFIHTGTDCGVPSQEICKSGANCAGLTDLDPYLVGPTSKYIVTIPTDPSSPSGTPGSGYEIYKSSTTGRITVCAIDVEQGVEIKVTR